MSPRLFIYPAQDKISNSACPFDYFFSLPVRGASSVMQNAGGSECTSQPCLKTQSERGGGWELATRKRGALFTQSCTVMIPLVWRVNELLFRSQWLVAYKNDCHSNGVAVKCVYFQWNMGTFPLLKGVKIKISFYCSFDRIACTNLCDGQTFKCICYSSYELLTLTVRFVSQQA